MADIPVPGPGRAQLAWAQQLTSRANLYEGYYVAKRHVSGGTLATFTATEVLIPGFSQAFTVPADRYISLDCRIKYLSNATNDKLIFRIRETGLSGTQLDEFVTPFTAANFGHSMGFQTIVKYSAVASKTFVLTVARLTGTGACNVYGGGGGITCYFTSRDLGGASVWTDI